MKGMRKLALVPALIFGAFTHTMESHSNLCLRFAMLRFFKR